jgi:TatD DNase family protein
MIFDTHCHLYDASYQESSEEVIQKCLDNHVSLMMIPGDNIENSLKAIKLAETFDQVYASIGIHPEEVNSISLEEGMQQLKKIFHTSKKIKAIGEIGLDKHWSKDEELIKKQKEYFIRQIDLANELNLPIIIHARDAYQDAIQIIKEHPVNKKGVFHCYSGSVEQLKEILKLGYYIGLDGPVTYKNAIVPKEVARIVPLDRLVIETDSPYMSPVPKRGSINYPFYLNYVVAEIAKIRQINSREIEDTTYHNGKELFNI